MIDNSILSMIISTQNHIGDWWDTLFRSVAEKEGFGIFGPSSYVVNIGGTHLLVDPCLRNPSWGEKIADKINNDLKKIDGIFLTHEHEDHCDPNFIRLAAGCDVRWYIPEFFSLNRLIEWGIPEERIILTHIGDKISLGETEVSVFESNHRNSGAAFVREYGFAVTHNGKNYVFPVDVRTYDPSFYPKFENAEILFAHLWLGRGVARNGGWRDRLDEFCEFLLSFNPKRIVLAHLYETERSPSDLWTYCHAGAVADRFLCYNPEISVDPLKPGIWYSL